MGVSRTYKCLDYVRSPPRVTEGGGLWRQDEPNPPSRPLTQHLFKPLLELRVGMSVILVVDLDESHPARTRGKVVGFQKCLQAAPTHAPTCITQCNSVNESKAKMTARICPPRTDDDRNRQYFAHTGETDWPVVRFDTGKTRAASAQSRTSKAGGKSSSRLLCRTQIPLRSTNRGGRRAAASSRNKNFINQSIATSDKRFWVSRSRKT